MEGETHYSILYNNELFIKFITFIKLIIYYKFIMKFYILILIILLINVTEQIKRRKIRNSRKST